MKIPALMRRETSHLARYDLAPEVLRERRLAFSVTAAWLLSRQKDLVAEIAEDHYQACPLGLKTYTAAPLEVPLLCHPKELKDGLEVVHHSELLTAEKLEADESDDFQKTQRLMRENEGSVLDRFLFLGLMPEAARSLNEAVIARFLAHLTMPLFPGIEGMGGSFLPDFSFELKPLAIDVDLQNEKAVFRRKPTANERREWDAILACGLDSGTAVPGRIMANLNRSKHEELQSLAAYFNRYPWRIHYTERTIVSPQSKDASLSGRCFCIGPYRSLVVETDSFWDGSEDHYDREGEEVVTVHEMAHAKYHFFGEDIARYIGWLYADEFLSGASSHYVSTARGFSRQLKENPFAVEFCRAKYNELYAAI